MEFSFSYLPLCCVLFAGERSSFSTQVMTSSHGFLHRLNPYILLYFYLMDARNRSACQSETREDRARQLSSATHSCFAHALGFLTTRHVPSCFCNLLFSLALCVHRITASSHCGRNCSLGFHCIADTISVSFAFINWVYFYFFFQSVAWTIDSKQTPPMGPAYHLYRTHQKSSVQVLDSRVCPLRPGNWKVSISLSKLVLYLIIEFWERL